jgi:DDE superfamily endonuclease
LLQDNLSTHTPASLYAAFPAPEARRLVNRFEWHYTPKHGSWLDMAESELAVVITQCLSRRIPDKTTSKRKSWPGRAIETNTTPKPTGNSRPRTSVSNWKGCTPSLNDSGD